MPALRRHRAWGTSTGSRRRRCRCRRRRARWRLPRRRGARPAALVGAVADVAAGVERRACGRQGVGRGWAAVAGERAELHIDALPIGGLGQAAGRVACEVVIGARDRGRADVAFGSPTGPASSVPRSDTGAPNVAGDAPCDALEEVPEALTSLPLNVTLSIMSGAPAPDVETPPPRVWTVGPEAAAVFPEIMLRRIVTSWRSPPQPNRRAAATQSIAPSARVQRPRRRIRAVVGCPRPDGRAFSPLTSALGNPLLR